MKTLDESIGKLRESAALGLRKHLRAVGISTWEDITTASLYDFRDEVSETLAPGSAKLVMASLKSVLNRVKDEIELPTDYSKILTGRGDTTRSTYLTPEELTAFENVRVSGAKERIVRVESLIEAYTGARISDVMTFTEENFGDGYLVYTSQKTRVSAIIPISEKTKGWIRYAQEHRDDEPSLVGRNRIIRRIAQKAGIDAVVKTRRGGVEKVTPKYEVLSSHSFRKSCATNLANAGATLTEIRNTLGHTSEAMTSRYIVASRPNLSKEALKYLL